MAIDSDSDDERLGTVLNGTWRLDEIVGTGGMGTVFKARHVHLGTACAIKVLVRQFIENQEAMKRFQREAQIASLLGHRNIVHVSDFNFAADGTPYMVMELLRGETVRSRLLRGGRLPLAEVVPLVQQLCDGLGAAHARGVVHRDLKPENLFLCDEGGPLKILDFGVSKIRDTRTQLTKPLAMIGTPYYMSPEQASGRTAEVDALADVWAVGAIAYELLTGCGAFSADNPVAVFYKILNEPLPALRAARVIDLPAALDQVLATACAKRPVDRYQTTNQLAIDFTQAAVSDEATRQVAMAPPVTPPHAPPSPPERTAAAATTTAAAAPSPPPLAALPDEVTPIAAAAPARRSGGFPDLAATVVAKPGPARPPVEEDVDATLSGAPPSPALAPPPAAQPAPPPQPQPAINPPARTQATRLPPRRPPPISQIPTTLHPILKVPTPLGAGEAQARPPVTPAHPSRFKLAALGVVTFATIVGIAAVISTRRRESAEAAARQAITQAISDRRWDDAAERLTALSQRSEDPTLGALAEQVTVEKRAAADLRKASAAYEHGDLADAVARLDRLPPGSVYRGDAKQLRDSVVASYERDERRALDDHDCDAARSAADKLRELVQRPVPDEVADCKPAPVAAPDGERSEDVPRHRRPPPTEAASGVRARDAMIRVLAGYEGRARACFAKEPGYRTPMRLRLTAFPGSDHYIAHAVSTGPIVIRACLEGLSNGARTPEVSAAVTAERLYEP